MENIELTRNEAETAVYRYIRAHGPISLVRVSSAHARGRAGAYPYWGANTYKARIGSRGGVVVVATSRAGSDRRSRALAEKDAIALARAHGAIIISSLGKHAIVEILTALIHSGRVVIS